MAIVLGPSAAMEYDEHIVEQLGARTNVPVVRLRETGRVPFRTRALHRFIGVSIEVRSEVRSVLDLLDKPDATWDVLLEVLIVALFVEIVLGLVRR